MEYIDIIMPVYNGEKYIKYSIESIKKQTNPNWKLIIIDDASTDKTLEEIDKSINDIKEKTLLIKSKKHIGGSNARNLGIEKATSNYIAFLDADDIWREQKLEKQISYLENHKEIDILGANMQEYDEDMKKKTSIRTVPSEDKEIKKQMKKRCTFNHSTVIIRREVLKKVGNYSTEYILEDYELWIRMMNNNCKMHNLNEILLDSRAGDALYKRRGGIRYIKGIIQIQQLLLKNRNINFFTFLINTLARCFVASCPNQIRKFIYINIIRKRWKTNGTEKDNSYNECIQ